MTACVWGVVRELRELLIIGVEAPRELRKVTHRIVKQALGRWGRDTQEGGYSKMVVK